MESTIGGGIGVVSMHLLTGITYFKSMRESYAFGLDLVLVVLK
jgi:hypothetical protein